VNYFYSSTFCENISVPSQKRTYPIFAKEILPKPGGIPFRKIQLGLQYILQALKGNMRARNLHFNRLRSKFVLIFLRKYRLAFRQTPVLHIYLFPQGVPLNGTSEIRRQFHFIVYSKTVYNFAPFQLELHLLLECLPVGYLLRHDVIYGFFKNMIL
jgi:hypothetical protein